MRIFVKDYECDAFGNEKNPARSPVKKGALRGEFIAVKIPLRLR